MSLADVDWPLRTERLTLQPLRLDDVPELWAYWQRREMQEWLGFRPASAAELREFTARSLEEGRVHTLVVRREGEVIGEVSAGVQDGWAQSPVRSRAEAVEAWLARLFHPAVSGQGYATEAVTALLELCFGPLRLRRVTASCFADNIPSWRLMERVGMRRESSTVADSLHVDRGWLDGCTYALLADEWREQR